MSVKPPNTMIGIGLMLAAMAVLPGIDVIAKFMGEGGTPVLQIVWARLTFGALLTLPFALPTTGLSGLLPSRPFYHGLRASLLIAATFFFFWSLKFLPIADALAIFFVQPLVVTALSPLILKEHVGPRRWAAVAVGFVGTMIIIRPGFGTLNPGALLALASGTSLALYFLMTRRIAGSQKAIVTTFHTIIQNHLHMIFSQFFCHCSSFLQCFSAYKLCKNCFTDNCFSKRKIPLNGHRR